MNINKNLMHVNITPCKRDKSDIDFIVIHYVGALGDAKANTDYYGSTYVGASADFWVGFKGDIWQGNDYYNAYSWHCGGGYQSNWTKDGAGEFYGICKNSNSIGIEMCVRKKNTATMNATDTDWYFEDATVKATAELTAHLMKELDISIDHVIRHYSVNKKICPNPMVIDYQKWLDFKNLVMKYYDGSSYEEEEKAVLYRVRKTWDDVTSQVGAFIILDNAKENCPEGYSVFDENGKAVYTAKASVPVASSEASGIPKSKEDYIEKVAKIAVDLYKTTKILPSVVISQCCLETGYGMGNDSKSLVERNNLLGMKSDLINNTWKDFTVWDGTSFTKRTPEVYNGVLTYINDSFRVYKDYRNCIEDYEMFLTHVQNGSGYKYRRIVGMTDPEAVITVISQMGYATDEEYIPKVMKLIKENNFTKYDIMAGVSVSDKHTSVPTTTLSYYRVAKAYKDGKYEKQLGAYSNKDNAINGCPSGYFVFDPKGNVTYPVKHEYLVRCGYSSIWLKAIARRNKVRKAGFDAVVKKMDKKYIVQCGIFENKENAEKLAKEIKKAGFGTAVIEI